MIGFLGDSWISAVIDFGTYGIPFWDIGHVGVMAHAADGRLLLLSLTTLKTCRARSPGNCLIGTPGTLA